jgi:acetyl-CoA acyltransferase
MTQEKHAMKTAVIVDAVRTPIGRAHVEKGYYRQVRSEELAAGCVRALVERNRLDPNEVEDVLFGCTQQTLEQGLNVSRVIALMAGLPVASAAATINRLCGSSLQAVNQAAHAIMSGAEDVQIVGGVEHMHHLPMDYGLDPHPQLYRVTSRGAVHMGITAEFLAQTQGISRAEQDRFALQSHQRAAEARDNGQFANEIIPFFGHNEMGQRTLLTSDQCIRDDSSLDSLSALKPAFVPKFGTVTAGNSSPINDGAAAVLMMSAEKAQSLGLTPLVRIRSTAVAGVPPCVMGTGPVPATEKALRRAGAQAGEIDLWEINEAFAVQTLACARMMQLDEAKLNVRGGALAIGHPLGASGARILTTLVHSLHDRGGRLGVATMCIGLGQGIATVVERW